MAFSRAAQLFPSAAARHYEASHLTSARRNFTRTIEWHHFSPAERRQKISAPRWSEAARYFILISAKMAGYY